MTQEEHPMARTAAVQHMYASDRVTTTPERLITMLFDRLTRDLVAGQDAIERGDRLTANEELIHAQHIVFELLSALDTSKWSGGAQLAQLYTWVLQQLVRANVEQDAAKVAHCRELMEPLGETWHEVAALVTQQHAQPVAGQQRAMGTAV
jgi:flagellar protein FliS